MPNSESLGDFVSRHAKKEPRKLPKRGQRSEKYKDEKEKAKK